LNKVRKGNFNKNVPDLQSIDPNAPSQFQTHEELDIYVRSLARKLYPSREVEKAVFRFKTCDKTREYADLLKGFDRAFRLNGDPGLRDGDLDQCPFPYSEVTNPGFKP